MKKGLFENIIFSGFCAVLVFALVAGGAVRGIFLWPVVLALGFLAWLGFCKKCLKGESFLSRTALDKPILAISLLALVSCVFSIYKQESILSVLCLGAFLGSYYLLADILDERKESCLMALVVMGVGLSVFGLLQYLGFLPHPWWVPRRFLASTYVNHNHFSGFLELVIPLALGLFIDAERKRLPRRWFFMAALGAMVPAFLFAQSRGAVLSLGAALSVMAFVSLRKRSRATSGVLAAFFIVGLVVFFVYRQSPALAGRMQVQDIVSNGDASWQTRLEIWEGGLQMVRERPWVGFGPGTFASAFPRFRAEGLLTSANFAHNDYLQSAVEMGLLAPLILFWLFVVIFKRGFGRAPASSWAVLGCATGILSLFLHGFIDFNFHIPANLLLCICFAALVARGAVRREGEGQT